MKILDSIRFRISNLLRRSKMDSELDEELRSHIQHRADDLERSGLPRAEAERRARIEFGPYQGVREDCQQAARGTFLESVLMDVRFGVRMLRKSPGFATVAILTLALAIGANAVVFAALNALILRPLNVPRAESLYSVHRTIDNAAGQSYPNYLDMRVRNRSFEDLVAYSILQAGLDTGQNPSRTWILSASGNYFDALGLQPYLGRFFHSSDEHGPNSAPYIVLSYGYWHSHFHHDPNVVGRAVLVNKHPYTIIGVAPPDFRSTLIFFSPDFYLPMVNQEQIDGTTNLNARGTSTIFMTLGHLKPGVTPEQAAADLNSVSLYLEKTYPQFNRHKNLALARPSLYGNYMGRPVRAFLTALMLLAALILLAACANLGSLFAARAADRSREVALRLALGARRIRILRQLFTEAILISVVGGALGLWGSILLLRWLVAWQPFPQFPIIVPVSPDANVYAVALLLALLSGLLFGAVPVRQVLRTDPYEIVKSGLRTTHGRRVTGRDLLVVAQIAICAVLVTSSAVAVRGLVRSMHSDFGFDPGNALLVNTILEMSGYLGDEVPAMQKRMTESVQAIPGVTAVGLIDWAPLSNGDGTNVLVFADDTADMRPANAAASPMTFKMSPDYFRAAGTPLLAGRNITPHDDKDAPRVAVITLEMARKMFGSIEDAIGRYFKLRDGKRIQIVGVVGDGKYEHLTEDLKPAVFFPILQSPASDTWLVVRSNEDPQVLATAIRTKLHDLDAGLPSFIQTWNQAMSLPLFPSRVAAVSLGVLGLMGAMLSVTGIFGMAAYSVSKRMREFGIRMALGAQNKEVLQAALGRALKLLAFGSAAGLVLGLLATKVLALIVYQATPRDPVVLAGVVVAMLLLGLLATWVPAQRALSVDPMVLLREE
jgi:predicted permease